MATELRGELQGEGLSFGIVVSRFNQSITSKLLEGARSALARHQVREDDITVAWVPGSFEVPLIAKKMAESDRYHAVICLGAVIRGETDHYDYVAAEAARGIADVSFSTGVPAIFAVLTTHNVAQAEDRTGGEHGNNGFDAGIAAIEMANLVRKLDEE